MDEQNDQPTDQPTYSTDHAMSQLADQPIILPSISQYLDI